MSERNSDSDFALKGLRSAEVEFEWTSMAGTPEATGGDWNHESRCEYFGEANDFVVFLGSGPSPKLGLR
jgi:hypothetical protein